MHATVGECTRGDARGPRAARTWTVPSTRYGSHMAGVRRGAIWSEAVGARWPVPVWPPAGCSAEDVREWTRLYKRLRWALRNRVDVKANVRPGARLARLRLAAKQRGLEVDLTLQDYEGLLRSSRCQYCDAALPATGHGVDRKNSALGYTVGNVVLACDACNRIKADLFTYEQMLEIGNLLCRWRSEGRWNDPQRKDGRRFGGRPVKGDLRREIEEVEREMGGEGGLRPAGGGWRRLRGRPGRPGSVCAPALLARAPAHTRRP